MKVFAYNENMEKIGELKFVQLLWDRKRYEPGTFTLYQQAQHYMDTAYIMAEGREEIGIVYKPEYKQRPNGRYVTTEGRFAEDMTNGATTNHGKTIVASRSLNEQLMEDLRPLGITEAAGSDDLLRRDDVMTRCMESGAEMYRILQLDQESFKVTWDKGWKLRFVKPRQTGLRFSKGLGNAKEITYAQDMSVYKHRCTGYVEIPKDIVDEGYSGTTMIGGMYYESESYTSTLDMPERFRQREMSVDLTMPEGIDITPGNKRRIKEQIIQMCRLELLDHYVVREIEVVPSQIEGCRYLIDYDLGDIVTVEIPELEVTYLAQIIEVHEVWEKNMQKYAITLGHKRIVR